MIMNTIDVFHIEHLIGPNFDIPAPMKHFRAINTEFDSLKPI